MSKKFNRLLIGAALAGAAAGVGIAYLQKYKKDKENWEEDFEDFEDDFEDSADDETDAEAASSREYVTIPKTEPTEEAGTETDETDAATQDTAETKAAVSDDENAAE